MRDTRLSNGERLQIGEIVAEGGEGKVFTLQSRHADKVLKVYHRPPDAAQVAKLVAMVQKRNSSLESAAAWPTDVAYDSRSTCIGFVMPRVDGSGVIDKLAHPAEQRAAFPTIDYGFLIHTSMNLMRAAATLHAEGCVIGDVNESNIVVLPNATIRFIDVDSFQIQSGHLVHRCGVGTALYTPPELQGVSFKERDRTPEHDMFGLAVLVFQLLVQGCHPFAGVPRDGRARTIEEAITERLYAYSTRGRTAVAPPPGRMSVGSLGELSQLFERAFTGTGRPTASDWMQALKRTSQRLRSCRTNPRHLYPSDHGSCHLCELPRDPLPSSGHAPHRQAGTTAIPIADLIREAGSIARPPTLSSLCRQSRPTAAERVIPDTSKAWSELKPAPSDASGDDPMSGLVGCAGVATVLLLCVYPPASLVGIIVVGILFAIASVRERDRKAARTVALDQFQKQRTALLDQYAPIRDAARRAAQALEEAESQADAFERQFTGELKSLEDSIRGLRNWLTKSDASLKRRLATAAITYQNKLRKDHLDRQIIARSSIAGIGPSRKAVLASFGIETASDVEEQRIRRIPGFGPHLAKQLMRWRNDCAARCPQARNATPPDAFLNQLRLDHEVEVQRKAGQLRVRLQEYRETHQRATNTLTNSAGDVDRRRSEFRKAASAAREL